MYPPRTSHFLLAALALLPSSLAASFECKEVLAKGQKYNFEKLGGPRVVHWKHVIESESTEYRYNFTLDICNKLHRDKGVKKDEWCHDGARVCGVRTEHDTNEMTNDTITPIDIAGTYFTQGGRNMQLDPSYELLAEDADSPRDGVRIELHGGRLPFDDKAKGMDQRAVIDFVCDAEREGDEGGEKDDNGHEPDEKEGEGDKKDDDKDKKDGEGDKKEEKLRRREDKKGKCEDSEASLRFCGYDVEDAGKDKKARTLRLEWRTKYACKNAPTPDGGSHWGFFTWFIIILFLATAAYLIFGSWLNYNRYGARGWDLLPHGDTIRDIPYIVKDIGRKVVNVVQSPGSRGGYSAV